MDEEKLKEVLADEEFVKSLVELESPEEVQTALKEKGVDITLKDIQAVQQALLRQSQQGDSELSDDALEDVAGGSLTVLGALGIASIIGASVAAGIKIGDSVNSWTRRRW